MTFSSRQLLVTGASGFPCHRIVDLGLRADWPVLAFNRSPRARFEEVEGDVGDSASPQHVAEDWIARTVSQEETRLSHLPIITIPHFTNVH
jgi:nucleoside-diphosphate-sugar epimerase